MNALAVRVGVSWMVAGLLIGCKAPTDDDPNGGGSTPAGFSISASVRLPAGQTLSSDVEWYVWVYHDGTGNPLGFDGWFSGDQLSSYSPTNSSSTSVVMDVPCPSYDAYTCSGQNGSITALFEATNSSGTHEWWCGYVSGFTVRAGRSVRASIAQVSRYPSTYAEQQGVCWPR